MTDDADLLNRMRHSTGASGGQFCQACQFLGRVYVTNQDGQPITHLRNYCAGCGNIVCDRHRLEFEDGDPRKQHHGVRDHRTLEPA